ncbi:Armadillo repeat-containing protein 6 [Hondaea fermentalgiana]|uniref:Armadillo repeat-containing protein 6 n=1 Tax=Hondaea fermentalgiana TaxID=2315210 RepID=A0A2R5GUL2_9STRA|nr:Armadillo repeat-containing protein 6 [Hondaea fermentalgiana]|eukprot:GBG34540.1 Armadillo repeat-containing protein 6 [Hondaea fermentalgiana]
MADSLGLTQEQARAAKEASCRVLSFRRRLGDTSFQVRGRSAVSLLHVLSGERGGNGIATTKESSQDPKQTSSDEAFETPEEICGLLRFYQGLQLLRKSRLDEDEAKCALEALEEARSLDLSSRVFRRFANLPEVAPQLWQAVTSKKADGSQSSSGKPRTLARCVESVQAWLHRPTVATVVHQAILDALRKTDDHEVRKARPRLLALWGSDMLENVLTADLMHACDGMLLIGVPHHAAATQALVSRVLELQAQGPQAGSLRKPLFLETLSLADYLASTRITDVYDVTLVTAGKIGGDGVSESLEHAALHDLERCCALADHVIFVDICAPQAPASADTAALSFCQTVDAAEVVLRCRSGSDRYKGSGDDPVVIWAAQRLGVPSPGPKDPSPLAVAGLSLEKWQSLSLEAGFESTELVSSPEEPLFTFVLHAFQARSRGIIVSTKRILEHSTDPNILAKALWALRFALTGETGTSFRVAAIQEHNLGSNVVEVFQAFRDHEDLQAAACEFVIPVTFDSDRNCLILEQELGVGKEIAAAMRNHPGSECVQHYACRALMNLAANAHNKEILVQELEVGQEIVAAMRKHPGSESVQEDACRALSILAANARNGEILGQDLKVGKEIVAAMRKHLGSESVQEMACGALRNLAGNIARNQEILGQELMVGNEIVTAMRKHAGSGSVQRYACGALSSLAANNARNKEILGQELKVGKDIVAAMRKHSGSEIVQGIACLALSILATNDRNCVILGQELKVGKDIVAAMHKHTGSNRVQKVACSALRNLAGNNARNQEILGQVLHVGEEIVAAMRKHSGSEGVQMMGCGALWRLAANDRNKEILGQELKVGKEIVAAMRKHPRSEAVQKQACGALENLAYNATVTRILRDQGAREAVQRACERFPSMSVAKRAKVNLRSGFSG